MVVVDIVMGKFDGMETAPTNVQCFITMQYVISTIHLDTTAAAAADRDDDDDVDMPSVCSATRRGYLMSSSQLRTYICLHSAVHHAIHPPCTHADLMHGRRDAGMA